MRIELMFLGLNILFLCIALNLLNPAGFAISLLLLAVVAVESVLGLGLLLSFYMAYNTIRFQETSLSFG